MSIQDELYQQAMALGMCEKFQKMWNSPTIKDLCDMYHKGLDFCIEHDFPSVEYLETNLKGQIEANGIYVNAQTTSKDQINIVVNGTSDMIVIPHDGACVTIRHNSQVHLKVPDNVFCYVTMRDNSKLIVKSKGMNSRLAISHFGGEIKTPELVDKVNEKD